MSGSGGKAAAGSVNVVLTLLQIAVAVAVPVITFLKLRHVEVESSGPEVVFACALDGEDGVFSRRMCNFAMVVGGLSLAAGLVTFVLQVLTCCICKVPQVVGLIFQILGAVWWLIGAGVLTRYAVPAFGTTPVDFPADFWRALVLGLSWLAFVAFSVGSCLGCVLLK